MDRQAQALGVKQRGDTRQALRFLAERRVQTHSVDCAVRGPSPGELRRFTQKLGAAALVDREASRSPVPWGRQSRAPVAAMIRAVYVYNHLRHVEPPEVAVESAPLGVGGPISRAAGPDETGREQVPDRVTLADCRRVGKWTFPSQTSIS
jgi:hypothetical protein